MKHQGIWSVDGLPAQTANQRMVIYIWMKLEMKMDMDGLTKDMLFILNR